MAEIARSALAEIRMVAILRLLAHMYTCMYRFAKWAWYQDNVDDCTFAMEALILHSDQCDLIAVTWNQDGGCALALSHVSSLSFSACTRLQHQHFLQEADVPSVPIITLCWD